MNGAHWHLVLNHLPVVGTLFLLFLLVAGFLQKSGQVQKLALVFAIIVALSAAAAYATGDGAELVVERLPGVTSLAIRTHEKAAELAFLVTVFLGGIALGGLVAFRRRERLPMAFMAAALAVALVAAGTMAWAAILGGQIRHTEIRNELALVNPISGLDPSPEKLDPWSRLKHCYSAGTDVLLCLTLPKRLCVPGKKKGSDTFTPEAANGLQGESQSEDNRCQGVRVLSGKEFCHAEDLYR